VLVGCLDEMALICIYDGLPILYWLDVLREVSRPTELQTCNICLSVYEHSWMKYYDVSELIIWRKNLRIFSYFCQNTMKYLIVNCVIF